MIEARALTRRFGGRAVVRDVSFRVEPGEVVGFLGPNGAGKTTTMRMLLGLLRPDGGDAAVDGPVGFLPEVFAGYDALSVRGYLAFMAGMKRAAADDVDRVATAAGVDDLLRRPVGRLSKGQRQRVGLAQALLGRPPSYVLDEPTQGLDPKQVVEMREVVRSLAKADGAAVLLSTHLLAEASTVCDRVVVIAKGRVRAEERPGAAPDLEARFLRIVGEAELEADD
ncbi:MAG TPA: ABC transporter ATP-binding protein [Acidimicrobiales bacterium]|nr:ABC transporter ATP-binding protein [Acidimicrobiales bacterium]